MDDPYALASMISIMVAPIIARRILPAKAGSAASMSETCGELGMALGIATLGSVGTAVYRRQVDAPANIPPETAEAVRDTLAGATAAAEQLPAELSTEVLEIAREAFMIGMNVVSGIGAVLLFGLAILAVTLLRHVRPIGEVDDRP